MLDLSLNIEDKIGPYLNDFKNPRTQSRITNFILARTGRRYVAYMRQNFLAGQLINGGKSSGGESLSSRIRVFKNKSRKNSYIIGEKLKAQADGRRVKLANIYEHAGGYVIEPKKKKSLLFVDGGGFWIHAKRIEGKARPFMSASFKSFNWDSIISAEGESVYKKEMEKMAAAK